MKSGWVSAHRTPDLLFQYAAGAREQRFLEGHHRWMQAAPRTCPVHDRSQDLHVPSAGGTGPIQDALNGIDSLLSIAQMPSGIPVATFAIGAAGAKNAALFAAAILANEYAEVRVALDAFRQAQTDAVLAKPDPRQP